MESDAEQVAPVDVDALNLSDSVNVMFCAIEIIGFDVIERARATHTIC
ncbi:MAG: hypothetical protein QOK38_2758 [Acidobacteriaceae bacterium]|nr:hypothetical protein [Acidobacteriaceae bacterium]